MTITLSTSLFYDRSASSMATLTARADTLNTQITSTKRLQAPSDDSVAYQRLQGMARATADDTVHAANLGMAASVLQQGDTALGAITTQLQQITELTTQANTGTLNADNRKTIGVQIAQIVDSIAALANGNDLRGQPLFGGADGGQAVTKGADGTYSYAQTTPSAIPTGDGQAVQANESATRLFTGGGTDMLNALAAFATKLQSGDDLGDAGAQALTDIKTVSDNVSAMRGSLGARAARVDVDQANLKSVAADRETARSALEDTDTAAAIIELQKTMTTLSATQASFSKLSSLSLFSYLK